MYIHPSIHNHPALAYVYACIILGTYASISVCLSVLCLYANVFEFVYRGTEYLFYLLFQGLIEQSLWCGLAILDSSSKVGFLDQYLQYLYHACIVWWQSILSWKIIVCQLWALIKSWSDLQLCVCCRVSCNMACPQVLKRSVLSRIRYL